jgi:cysteine desulfurase
VPKPPLTDLYLDHAATTPLRPQVAREMRHVQEEFPGNPSSPHRWGQDARRTLQAARDRVADVLDVPAGAVFFVRGGTESDNLAILGRADRSRSEGHTPLILYSSVEHSAVREAAQEAVRSHGQAVVFGVDPSGQLDLTTIRETLERHPDPSSAALLSCMWVNNETGTVLAMEELLEVARAQDVPLHVDAVQGAGKLHLAQLARAADLLSLSGHKLGGPRSMGILVCRDRSLLSPRLFGGGQEDGLRPGTEDVAGAAGMAQALELATHDREGEAARLTRLRDRLEEGLKEAIPDLRIHGAEGPRAPHITNVGIPGLPADVLPGALDLSGVRASAGSACRSGSSGVSPVLAEFYGEAHARGVAPLRLSLGWNSTPQVVEGALKIVPRVLGEIWSAGIGTRPS